MAGFDFEFPELAAPGTVEPPDIIADIMRGPVEEPSAAGDMPLETPVPVAIPSPAPLTTARQRRDAKPARKRLPLFFDLETIPDEVRGGKDGVNFGLDALADVASRGAFADCPDIGSVKAGTVEQIKKSLAEHNPCEQWLAEFEKAEKAGDGKKSGGRKEVLKAITELRGQDELVFAARVERRKLLSVTPEYCRIIAFGWAFGDSKAESMVVGQPDKDGVLATEEGILEHFWLLAEEAASVVGANCLHFDLPTIFIRSALLKIKPSRRFDLAPWKSEVVDVMRARFPKMTPAGFNMKRMAALYGIDVPAEGVDGSQVEELYRTEPAKVGEYVRSDVHVCREIHQFFQGLFV